MARHGADFILNKMWDAEHGGLYWMLDRKGKVKIDQKIIYGHSFAIYSFSEYTLATGDERGVEYAEKVFDLLQKYYVDSMYGRYREMFHRDWTLVPPEVRVTTGKHYMYMHLMEAFTTLFESTGKEVHRRKLTEDICSSIVSSTRFIRPAFLSFIKTGLLPHRLNSILFGDGIVFRRKAKKEVQSTIPVTGTMPNLAGWRYKPLKY